MSETKRLHTDHSTRDVVMLLNHPDVSRAVEQCREVCRRKETFLVDVNDLDCEFRDTLHACGSDGTTVACSRSGTTRELMSCLFDLLAADRNGNGNLQRKTNGVCVRQHKRGILGAVGHCEEFNRVFVHRAKIRCCGTVNKGSDDAPQLRAWWVAQEFRGRCGDKHEYFSETPDLTSIKAVIAHAPRRAQSEDIVVAVFDVRRAYLFAEEKRDTFVELPDYVPAEFRTTHVGKLRKALHGNSPSCSTVGK